MKDIQQKDRVQVVNVWPLNAKGAVHHFTSDGTLAYVVFDKQHFTDGNWYEYNWYSRDNLAKLAPEAPKEAPELPPTDDTAFKNTLFPDCYASFNDAMRACGADGEE